jgi:hypothetical protein
MIDSRLRRVAFLVAACFFMVPVGRIVVLGQAEKSQIMRLMSYIVWPGLIAPVIAPLAGGAARSGARRRWTASAWC